MFEKHKNILSILRTNFGGDNNNQSHYQTNQSSFKTIPSKIRPKSTFSEGSVYVDKVTLQLCSIQFSMPKNSKNGPQNHLIDLKS